MQRRGKVGECKLCRQQAKLHCSHIIPEFCYKSIYRSKHQLTEVRVSPQGLNRRISQKGYKEPMLCSSCEQKMNIWETAFHDFWYSTIVPSGPVTQKYPVIDGFDYKWMKLFHLSVIWRLHSAEGFGRIDLGSYAEQIRDMLLRENAGLANNLPVFGCLLLDDTNKIMDMLITEPGMGRWDNSYFYSVSYAGCEWLFLMVNEPTKKQKEVIDAFGIQVNGSMRLMTAHYKRSRSWDKLVREIRSAIKGRSI